MQNVWEHLNGAMSGEIVFWEEIDVHEQIMVWKINKNRQAKPDIDPGAESGNPGSEESKVRNAEPKKSINKPESGNDAWELRAKAKRKLEQYKADSGKLYDLLVALAEKHSIILEDIDNLL